MTRLRLGITTAAIGFFAGVTLLIALAWWFGTAAPKPPVAALPVVRETIPVGDSRPVAVDAPVPVEIPPAPAQPPPTVDTMPPGDVQGASIGVDSVAELRRRTLEVPVEGVARGALRESFDEMRNATQRHDAIDIMAPRNTPILAVEDGVIAKLFTSVAGGLTVYQWDPSRTYAYYYAHLERYADGLTDGMRVTRRQVLGYVGTSGNAPVNTPHLHFEISRLVDAKQWWKGTAIDPFRVLK